MDLISVIVPVYKVEKYLDRCVKSIVSQTYKNLEIILVDDGSPDNCPAMCDAWGEKDSRVKVFHQTNRGVSAARNTGINFSKGKYIAFVDSDDWIGERFIEVLYSLCQTGEFDISACNVKIVDENGEQLTHCNEESLTVKVVDSENAFRDVMNGIGFRATPWNKLYKRSLFENIEFPEEKKHEDEFFTTRIIHEAQKLIYTSECLYYYVQQGQSWMHTSSIQHLDALDAHLERVELFKNYYRSLYLDDKVNFCIACSNFYMSMLQDNAVHKKVALKRIKQTRRKVRFSVHELQKLNIKNIIYVIGSNQMFIGLFSRIRVLRGKMR